MTDTDSAEHHFVIGRGERRRRPVASRRPRPAALLNTQWNTFRFQPAQWLILPSHETTEDVRRVLQFIPYGLKAVYKALEQFREPAPSFSKTPQLKGFRTGNAFFKTHTLEFILWFDITLEKNQRLRFAMKKLMNAWRRRRHVLANTEDMVTMEAPKTPIRIVDWAQKRVYLFEARTLSQDMRTKLTHTSNLFPMCQHPKNPYTNQPWSYAQLHFAIRQLRKAGYTDWTLEGFANAGYDLQIFQKINRIALGLNAIKHTFGNPTSDECIDLVFDFIEAEYDYHDAVFHDSVWLFALRHHPEHPRVAAWRSWCCKRYKAYFHPSDESFPVIEDGIRRETGELVKQPITELRKLYAAKNSAMVRLPGQTIIYGGTGADSDTGSV